MIFEFLKKECNWTLFSQFHAIWTKVWFQLVVNPVQLVVFFQS